MIVVEGPDNSGKSTLAARLAMDLDLEVIHTGGPKNSETLFKVMEEVLTDKKGYVYDRVPVVSEKIYGPVLRGIDLLDTDRAITVFRHFCDRNPLIIYCRPSNKIILERVLERKPHDTAEHIHMVNINRWRILTRYDSFMRELCDRVMVLHYDYEVTPVHFIISAARRYL